MVANKVLHIGDADVNGKLLLHISVVKGEDGATAASVGGAEEVPVLRREKVEGAASVLLANAAVKTAGKGEVVLEGQRGSAFSLIGILFFILLILIILVVVLFTFSAAETLGQQRRQLIVGRRLGEGVAR